MESLFRGQGRKVGEFDMLDMEKVIKGLECCHNKTMLWQHDQCPYHGFDEDCESNLHADALTLLKEPEAKTVIKIAKRFNDCDLTGFCPFCSRPLIKDWAEKYCGYCGNPVLWEGR